MGGINSPGEFKFTDTAGNMLTFFDVPRSGGGVSISSGYAQELSTDTTAYPDTSTYPYHFGSFVSETDAFGNMTTATYSTATAQLMALVRTDAATGAQQQYAISSSTVSNTNGGSVSLISAVTLEHRANSGTSWIADRSAEYTYYTGDSTGADAANGRLGDLKLVTIKDSAGSIIDERYYRYNKFWSENAHFTLSSQPTSKDNITATGGTDTTFYVSGDNVVTSGLKSVVEDAFFSRLTAAKGNLSAIDNLSDSDIAPYVENSFTYERYDATASLDYFAASVYQYRVIQEVAAGNGCSSCSGGFGTYLYSYVNSAQYNLVAYFNYYSDALTPNVWVMETTVTLPDESQEIVFTNAYGEVLLTSQSDPSGSMATQNTYYNYDAEGRLVFTAHPSAVTGYDTSYDNLVGYDESGRSPYLNLRSGLITFDDYYAATSSGIDDTTAGGVAGYLEDQGVGLGELSIPARVGELAHSDTTVTVYTYDADGFAVGDNVLISNVTNAAYDGSHVITAVNPSENSFTYELSTDPDPADTYGDPVSGTYITAVLPMSLISEQNYFSHSYNDATIYPVASSTIYRNTDGTGAETTNYAYTWYSNSLQMKSQTTTLPGISSSQNGPGTTLADTTVDYFDNFGRVVFHQDGGGYINYTQYDSAGSGGIVKTIQDADTSVSTEFTGGVSPTNFAGLSSPSGTRLHLTNNYTVDGLGRTTSMTDPNGNLTYAIYNDANHEVRTYSGWHSVGGGMSNTTGPVIIQREFRPTGTSNAVVYEESITATILPESSAPTGSENFYSGGTVGGTIQALSRDYTNNAGQVVQSDRYSNFGTNTYSTASHFGVAGTNYYATAYGYDHNGRQNRVDAPTGTITRTVYDALARVTSMWTGTNDTPVSGYWSTTNVAGMTKIQDNYYDTYDPQTVGIGDGNLTRTVEYPTGTNGVRVTENYYDYRDRIVATKSGVLLDSSNRFANPSGETDGVHRPITYSTYDNLDEVTQTDQYDGDGVALTDGSTHLPLLTNGVPTTPSSTALRARVSVNFDDQGRPFQTSTYDVNQTNGTTASATLNSNTWYDHRGNVTASQSAGGVTTKMVYDGAGRLTTQYTTDGGQVNAGAGTVQSWSNAASVSVDIVLSQTEMQYDADGNAILITTRDRYHNDATNGAGLGSLMDPSSNPKARVSFQSFYYDQANRKTASADWGTLGGTNNTGGVGVISLTSAPARSGTVLVDTFGYSADAVQSLSIGGSPTGGTFTLTFNGHTTGNIAYNANANGSSSIQSALAALTGVGTGNVAVTGNGGIFTVRFMGSLAGLAEPLITSASSLTGGSSPSVSTVNTSVGGDNGRLQQTTDPRGIVAKTDYDMLGRTTRTISAFSTGIPSASTDQTTEYAYDGDDHILTQKAWVNNGGASKVFQTTAYVYGVTTSTSGINSNDLLAQTEYPNTSTGNPGTASPYVESYTYDALGEQTKKTQRTGSVHQYNYDPLGRMTSDNVITLGSGVNGSIRRLDYAFDTGGRLYTSTSRSGTASTSTIVNQVMDLYNGLGQLTQEYQSHTGAVVTSGTPTTSIQYTYSEMAGGANNSRLTGIVYPTGGRTVNYDYSGNGGLDNIISRLSALTQTLVGTTTTLEDYDYLGIDTVVRAGHPQTGIDLTYERQTGDTSAVDDAGDIYTGLDRFGRVSDQNYLKTSSGTSTDRFLYGYDADSNAMYRKNLVSSSNSELYHSNGTSGAGTSYDSLNRLTNFQRGTLASGNTSISGSPSTTRSWTLDAQGNWNADTNGNALTTNDQNQYTSMTGTVYSTGSGCGSSSSGGGGGLVTSTATVGFTYDNDGNMTSRPVFDNSSVLGTPTSDTFSYDAWDREVAFEHTVDVTGNDITETTTNYDALGRELQLVTHPDGTGTQAGFLPSDDLYYSSAGQVLEDDQTQTIYNSGGSISTAVYSQMQFVWSPTYVNDLVLRDRSTAGNGTFDERLYVQHDANHDVTAITNTSGSVLERFVYDPYGTPTVLGSSWSGTTESYGWQYLFQGGRYDTTTGLVTFDHRELDTTTGRWIQQDPNPDGIYNDGANLYQFVGSSPVGNVDPSGLQWYNGWGTALLSIVQLAPDPVQDAFNQSNYDRTNGTLDNINRRLHRVDSQVDHASCGLVQVEPRFKPDDFSFDPEDRASADRVAEIIIDADEVAISVASLRGLASAGQLAPSIVVGGNGAAVASFTLVGGASVVDTGIGALSAYDLFNHPTDVFNSRGSGGSNDCERSKNPIAKRYRYNTRKEAYEAAKRAGKGAEPIHHEDGEFGPHFHPDVRMPAEQTPHAPNPHDHYYY